MLRLRTLGTVSLEADGSPLSGRATQRRRLALLTLLAVARDRGFTRDKLLAYLWPERDTEHARHALSQTLYALRHDLGSRALIGGIDEVRLNPEVVTTDIAEFRDAISAGDPERAISIYGGPFLDGFFVANAAGFERWADEERGRIAGEYGLALERLAREAEKEGNHGRAAHWWRQRATLDPLNSEVALSLMRTLVAGGDRVAALQHVRLHSSLVREELDLPADPAVEAFSERLRTEQPANTGTAPVMRATPPGTVAAGGATPIATAYPASERLQGIAHSVAWLRGRRSGLAGVGAALVVIASGVLALTWLQSTGAAPSARRTVVLAELRGADSTLALAVHEALRAELASAPDVHLIGETSVRETLRLMAKSDESPLTAPVARDVAQRRGARFVIEGSVSSLGMGAQLVARLIDASTGAPVATVVERPATDADVVPAVSRLARALRGKLLGVPIADAPQPLPAVTTASLPALQSYALARRALAGRLRHEALVLAEAALEHDSLFALAHYLLGDLLWFVDDQRHGESHLTSAYELSGRLPPRERLLVRARYTHLVLDRPDSALTYWRLLRAAFPNEPLAYEGMGWAFRALGRPDSAAAAAEEALRLDPRAILPNARNHSISLIELGDTTGALDAARRMGPATPGLFSETRFLTTSLHGGPDGARAALTEQGAGDIGSRFKHTALLALGRFTEAELVMEEVVRVHNAQEPPRVLISQARAEIGAGLPHGNARALGRRALQWLQAADLSPPAYTRIAERIAELSARTGDTATIMSARSLIAGKDAGRELPSYHSSLLAIDAAAAFARGDMSQAAALAERAREWPIFARSIFTLILLEADARRALGEHERADSLYRGLLEPVPFNDGDIETVISMRPLAEQGLERF